MQHNGFTLDTLKSLLISKVQGPSVYQQKIQKLIINSIISVKKIQKIMIINLFHGQVLTNHVSKR